MKIMMFFGRLSATVAASSAPLQSLSIIWTREGKLARILIQSAHRAIN